MKNDNSLLILGLILTALVTFIGITVAYPPTPKEPVVETQIVTQGVLIEVFTIPECYACRVLKTWLDENNIKYKSYDISISKEAADEYEKRRQSRDFVPQVYVNGKYIGYKIEHVKAALDKLEV